ncbi:hypothetical protein IFM89_035823 [Coptis chinensis]|uniref:DNA-directed RNA polymerase n=1 Tax=Coptis chinensis TaxID=261450 RepID=A0A835I8B8_9MAGN|nr:hypothetical protein IFM89_035823 [Coptis chinensis]
MAVVFRALGFIPDKAIWNISAFDLKDHEMMELLQPSLEEAFVIQSEEVALDYIGKRGSLPGASKEKRIKFAKIYLQKEMVPHARGLWRRRSYSQGNQDFCQWFFGLVFIVVPSIWSRTEAYYGRCSRPLFIVENQWLLIKKRDIENLQQRPEGGGWNELVTKHRYRRRGDYHDFHDHP